MALELLQAEPARRALANAAASLRSAEQKLVLEAPDYAGAAGEAVKAIRSGLTGMLIWHGVSFENEAPLSVLGRKATQLNSMLRTPLQRARPIEALARTLKGKSGASLPEQEAVRSGFYTARNMLRTIFDQLPETILPDADRRAA